MNKRLLFLFLIVASQLAWLGVSYARRAQDLAEAPRVVLACESVDPRDLFRGDYLNLRLQETVGIDWQKLGPSLTLGDDVLAAMVSEYLSGEHGWLPSLDMARAALQSVPAQPGRKPGAMPLGVGTGQPELVSFWKCDGGIWRLERLEKQGSPEDRARAGETRIPHVTPDVRAFYRFGRRYSDRRSFNIFLPGMGRWSGFRFYVPEKTGEIVKIWRERYPSLPMGEYLRLSVGLALLPEGRCFPVELYINGMPYDEAVARIRAGNFELNRVPDGSARKSD